MSQKRFQSISERFRDVLKGYIDDFMVKFQWDSVFDGFESVLANRKGILDPRGTPESSKSPKNPRNERPPSIAISTYQKIYQTPSELGERSIRCRFFFSLKKNG